jgi:alkanesulfonate monooxygenase SsuD/methylene tetrahydromethanopterin reductase-like flavin-dependent oxidoreductase (luciferase family)
MIGFALATRIQRAVWRHPGRARRGPGVDPGQQRRGECPGSRGQRAAVRGQLPRQPARLGTQFAGSPGQVADQLEQLRDATAADGLIITTITHDHADRVRSYQRLAEEWARR